MYKVPPSRRTPLPCMAARDAVPLSNPLARRMDCFPFGNATYANPKGGPPRKASFFCIAFD